MKDSHSPDTQSKDSVFSVYLKPIKNTTPTANVNIGDIYQSIIDPSVFATETAKIREAIDKETRNSLKANTLDFATFSGTFTKRSTKNLIQHSGLICIDIDDIDDIPGTKERIISTLPPVLMFTSPSGNGLKVVYRIAIEQADHLHYFKALEQFFLTELNIGIDSSGKDIARACFLCHDPDAYFNPDSPELDIAFFNTFQSATPPQQRITTAITDYEQIMDNLKTWLNGKKKFEPGKRNAYITALAHAYNRCGIPQQTAEYDLLQFEESDFKANEIRATVRSIYAHYSGQFGTQKFMENLPYQFNEPEPTPAPEPKISTPLLPIDGFPKPVQSFINEFTRVYNTPRDYIAGAVLFAFAFAIGDKLHLRDKYKNIPLLWMATVGHVSTQKTYPTQVALNYFTESDKRAYKAFRQELSEYTKTENKEVPPTFFQYVLTDYTPEAMFKAHLINQRGICIYRDELKGWLDDFGRYNKSGEQSSMLSTFFRLPMAVNRAGKEVLYIDNPTIYVTGGIQPDLLPDLAKDSRAENGFLSRMIFVYPDEAEKQYYSTNTMDYRFIKEYENQLDILATIPEQADLFLSAEAKKEYEKWYNHNADLTNKQDSGYIKGVFGKLDVIVLRLAITVQGMKYACDGYADNEISKETMQTAIQLIEYFRLTALKVYRRIFKDGASKNFQKIDVIKYLSKLGASQNEIAKAVKVSQPYINKILNNDRL